jgi:hypothetical protein
MHRVVLGYGGPLDVDHRDRDTLNNQRHNIRIATRSENVRNTAYIEYDRLCVGCGLAFTGRGRGSGWRKIYCSMACHPRSKQEAKANKKPRAKANKNCQWCGSHFESNFKRSRFCSESCRKKARWARCRDTGIFPPSKRPGVSFKVLGGSLPSAGAKGAEYVYRQS